MGAGLLGSGLVQVKRKTDLSKLEVIGRYQCNTSECLSNYQIIEP